MKGIVVGSDGSESSAVALRWALDEATLRDEPVTAVLAWGFMDQYHADPEVLFDPAYGERDAAAALRAFVERAVGTDGLDRVERVVLCDLPVPALLGAAAGSALLVLGSRGRGGFRGLLLGSVSQHCLHNATAPIAIVRTSRAAERPTDVIVVGIDGSGHAGAALEWAAREARLRKAQLQVVMSWHTPFVGGYPYVGAAFDPSLFEQDARKLLDELVDEIDVSGIPHVDRVLAMGDAAATLLSAAESADLLVVGSRGLGGFKGLLLGSVSHHLAHHATCPLVVIPPSG